MGILRLNCYKYLCIQVIKVAFQILNFIQVVIPNGYYIWKLAFDKSAFSPIIYLPFTSLVSIDCELFAVGAVFY